MKFVTIEGCLYEMCFLAIDNDELALVHGNTVEANSEKAIKVKGLVDTIEFFFHLSSLVLFMLKSSPF